MRRAALDVARPVRALVLAWNGADRMANAQEPRSRRRAAPVRSHDHRDRAPGADLESSRTAPGRRYDRDHSFGFLSSRWNHRATERQAVAGASPSFDHAMIELTVLAMLTLVLAVALRRSRYERA